MEMQRSRAKTAGASLAASSLPVRDRSGISRSANSSPIAGSPTARPGLREFIGNGGGARNDVHRPSTTTTTKGHGGWAAPERQRRSTQLKSLGPGGEERRVRSSLGSRRRRSDTVRSPEVRRSTSVTALTADRNQRRLPEPVVSPSQRLHKDLAAASTARSSAFSSPPSPQTPKAQSASFAATASHTDRVGAMKALFGNQDRQANSPSPIRSSSASSGRRTATGRQYHCV